MAHPTPRADALRQMREAKFEAEQKRLKQETGKPAEAPKRKAEPLVDPERPAAKPAAAKKAAKAAKSLDVAETIDNSVAAAPDTPVAPEKAAKKAAPKKAAKKAKAAAG